MSELGERIKYLRKANNLTQQQLAERLKIDQGAVSRWEKGHITPSPRYRQELEQLLKASLLEADTPLLDSVNKDVHFTLLIDCQLKVLAASPVSLAVHGCRHPDELIGQSYRPLLESPEFDFYRWLKDAGAFDQGIRWASSCLASPTLHSGQRWMESLWIPFKLARGSRVYRISSKLLNQAPQNGLGYARMEVAGQRLEQIFPVSASHSEKESPNELSLQPVQAQSMLTR